MADEIDQVTLARAGRGDPSAFAPIVACHQQRVFALCGRMLLRRSPAAVDDVAQEVFLRVHRGLPGFDPAGPAPARLPRLRLRRGRRGPGGGGRDGEVPALPGARRAPVGAGRAGRLTRA